MEINTLPTEILKQIFEKITYERKYAQCRDNDLMQLHNFALNA